MPRHPRPLDPESGPLAVFALELRALRQGIGPTAPTIDQISANEQIPRSTLYAAMSGTRMPTEDVLAALVRSWQGDLTAWMIKRAAVLQEIGLRRLRDEAVGTLRAQEERKEKQASEKLTLAEEFGRDLRHLRTTAGLTLRELKPRLLQTSSRPISRSTVVEVELGRRLPSWRIVEDILRAILTHEEFDRVALHWKARWEQLSQGEVPRPSPGT